MDVAWNERSFLHTCFDKMNSFRAFSFPQAAIVFGAHFALLTPTDGIADHHLDCCRLVADGREQCEANHLRLHATLAGRVLVVRLDMTDSDGRTGDVCAICRRRVPCTWNRALRSQLRRTSTKRSAQPQPARARKQAGAARRRSQTRRTCMLFRLEFRNTQLLHRGSVPGIQSVPASSRYDVTRCPSV
jgi:hypothetical protein